MSEGIDRREFTRVLLPFPVRVRHGSTVIQADQGLNVSGRGVSITTGERVPPGSTCTIEIMLADSMAIEAEAVVSREHEDGFVVEITEIDLDGFELLKNLIRFNAEDPAMVDREFGEHLGLLKR